MKARKYMSQEGEYRYVLRHHVLEPAAHMYAAPTHGSREHI